MSKHTTGSDAIGVDAATTQRSGDRLGRINLPDPGRRAVRLLSWAVIIVGVIVILRALPTAQAVDLVQRQVATMGIWGPVAFGAAYLLGALLFVPGSALTLAAGALFGLGIGMVTVSVASTTAAGAAFLIGRYIAREKVREVAQRKRIFGAIDRAIAEGGWKVVALLRLSPAVLFSLGNYLFGLTPVRFWPYVAASWAAMLPGTFLYVYLGFAGGRAAAGETESVWEWVLLGVGLLATVAVTVYITKLARKALKETPLSEPEQGAIEEAPAKRRKRPRPVLKVGAAAVGVAILAACAETNRNWLRGLFGPPAVTMQESFADAGSGEVFDHSVFDRVLSAHVYEGGFIDYRAIADDPSDLDKYIDQLAEADPDALDRDERLALLINAYNAFTLRLILDYMPVDSIRDIPRSQRWDHKRWDIGGKLHSLNQIEHEIIRPNFAEPRIHFVLVCAAVGCPPLRNEAYTGEKLEAQLADQSEYVHSHDRWFVLDKERNELHLTQLYQWYAGDYEQQAPSVTAYAAQFCPEVVRLINAGREPRVRFLDYSWKLNSLDYTHLAGDRSK